MIWMVPILGALVVLNILAGLNEDNRVAPLSFFAAGAASMAIIFTLVMT